MTVVAIVISFAYKPTSSEVVAGLDNGGFYRSLVFYPVSQLHCPFRFDFWKRTRALELCL